MSAMKKLIMAALLMVSACDAWHETDNLAADAKPPTASPPPIHGAPDAQSAGAIVYEGTELAGSLRVESDRPMDMDQMLRLKRGFERRQSVDIGEVELRQNAVIVNGMRSCDVWPNQQPGEVSVRKVIDASDPNTGTSMCLQHNGNWPSLHSPQATYVNGEPMADNIRKASFFVPAGQCVGFKPYAHENYVERYGFIGDHVCRSTTGENWLLWNANWQISSIKTAYKCYSCPWPSGF